MRSFHLLPVSPFRSKIVQIASLGTLKRSINCRSVLNLGPICSIGRATILKCILESFHDTAKLNTKLDVLSREKDCRRQNNSFWFQIIRKKKHNSRATPALSKHVGMKNGRHDTSDSRVLTVLTQTES
ncbi:hypothetical protein AVEN_68126-1 [Araneus ventricosus]|uniref:Uncharacterized protein n=1 Tax=Araneus ventricosus TaxID=182803 RepID=A0A4Y2K7W7_ARAVE|nr:hypothetical protein AVEN_68126-1 [Araneus ventricosus]